MKHTYYETCENCGALLDPGEVCSCEREQIQEADPEDDLFFERLEESFSAG